MLAYTFHGISIKTVEKLGESVEEWGIIMPVFEKSQPRKFTPIHYEPRQMQGGKEGTSSRASQGTDIFLQKRDHGIRYVDWASKPQTESGKRYTLYERAGFWQTLWETVCHWFRKPTPLLKDGQRGEKGSGEREPKGERPRGKGRGERTRKPGGRDSVRKPEKKGVRDSRGGGPKNSIKAGDQADEGGVGGSRRNRSRRRRPEGEQGRELGQARGNSSANQGKPTEQRTRHLQSKSPQVDSRSRSGATEARSGSNPQGHKGGDEENPNRRRNRNRRNRNRGRSGGPGQTGGENSRKNDGAGE